MTASKFRVVVEFANTNIRAISYPIQERGGYFGTVHPVHWMPWAVSINPQDSAWNMKVSQVKNAPALRSAYVEFNGQGIIFGQAAISKGAVRSVGDKNKYTEKYMIPALHAALSKAVPEGKNAKEPVDVELYFLYAPGTPTEMIISLGKMFRGKHDAVVDGHKYSWKVSLNPNSAIMETIGGITYYALDNKLQYAEIVVVDAGGFAGAVIGAEIEHSYNSINIAIGEVLTIEGGAITIGERIVSIIREKTDAYFFSLEDAMRALTTGQAMINGSPTDISEIVNDAMAHYMAQIEVAINRLGKNYYIPVFTGGTAAAVYWRLQQSYFSKMGLTANLVCPQAPWFGNIRGAGLYVNSLQARREK